MGGTAVPGPTQNTGVEIKQREAAGGVLSAIAMVVAMAPTSDIGKSFAKSLSELGKMIPPGSTTQQGHTNFYRDLMQRQIQSGPQMAAMQRPPGAPQSAPPGATPQSAPPPGMAA